MTQPETLFWTRTCPLCAGYVEQDHRFWKLKAVFHCTKCGQELVTKSRPRLWFGVVYAIPAAYTSRFLLDTAAQQWPEGTPMYKLINGVLAIAVAVPAVVLLFRGLVYVPKPDKNSKAQRTQPDPRNDA